MSQDRARTRPKPSACALLPGDRVRLLHEDPELARGLDPLEFADARERCTARMMELDPAPWGPAWASSEWLDCAGLFLLRGAIMRRASVAGRQSTELLGPGDVFHLWDEDDAAESLASSVAWKVCERSTVAILDRRFQQAAVRWPEINAALVARVLARSASLSARLALVQIPRLAERLRLALWHLADRWGRVDPDGVVLLVRLSHQVLAELVSAQRPSVSHAMRELVEDGHVARTATGHWRLLGAAPEVPTAANIATA